ncbi:MAG: mucin desulfatase, partial [Clostridia bacterium]|nr:mucin desulfatase [Clostridia bacterium]
MGAITQEELAVVVRNFTLEGEINNICPYGSGHINDTFRLSMNQDGKEKSYILQRMNGEIFKNREELMENITSVTSFLKEKILAQGGNPDRETLQIIPTKDGKSYYTEKDGDGW